MPNIRQILVDWTTINGSGKVSVLYFESGIAVATQRTALQTFLTAVKAHLDNSVSYVIRPNGIEVDDATGTLTGAWSETSGKSGVGGGGGEPVADATQMLMRWKTSTIVNKRFLQGRTFFPGLATSNLVNGNLNGATGTAVQTAGDAFIASAAGLVVWHRPIAGSGGLHDAVSTCQPQGELAVLRRRRG